MANTEQFERMAARYDDAERMNTAQLAAEAIRKMLGDTNSQKAMDFGCGTGLVGLELVNEFKEMVFVDTSANMLEQVQLKITAGNIQNASVMQLDLESEQVQSIKFDCIMMTQVLLHIPSYQEVLSKLYDMLSAKGQLIIVDYNQNPLVTNDKIHPGFEQEHLKGVLETIGFQTVESKTFHHGSGLLAGQDASLFCMSAVK